MPPLNQPSRNAEAGARRAVVISNGTSAIQASGQKLKSGKDRTRRDADSSARGKPVSKSFRRFLRRLNLLRANFVVPGLECWMVGAVIGSWYE